MDIISVAPGVGSLVAMRALFPYLGYARGLFLTLFVSAGACAGSAVAPRGAAVAAAGFFATIGWGVYPSMTGLLTPEEEPEHQGHLQAALTRCDARPCCALLLPVAVRALLPYYLKPNSAELAALRAAALLALRRAAAWCPRTRSPRADGSRHKARVAGPPTRPTRSGGERRARFGTRVHRARARAAAAGARARRGARGGEREDA